MGQASVESILQAAWALPADSRQEFIERACRGDASLRAAVEFGLAARSREAGETQDLPASASSRPAVEPVAPTRAPAGPGLRIGRYAVNGILGEGGMGVVYRATQQRPNREVALKLLRSGHASKEQLRRFEFEAETLGRLTHPGIAQIYEAGIDPASGSPFFAMELVHGEPLTQYADRRGLSTRDRLHLFAEICRAVHYAHTRGVIHRDLKPSNILVTEGGDPPAARPKILDFGVARLTDTDTQSVTLRTDIGQLIGTVPYMSPEQVAGDPAALDTRSDVYALGVVLYELLAGRLPYDLGNRLIHEAVRVIREEEPSRLSSIDRTFRGDVETIVGKALEKERNRRYQSAGELATDIDRYLGDEPILARPASTWYQVRKFSRRHRGLVVGLALAFAILAVGLVGTSYGLRQAIVAGAKERIAKDAAEAARKSEALQREVAEQERDAAQAARARAELVSRFMSETLQGAGPGVAKGRDITLLKEMMDAAATRILRGDLKEVPSAELELRGTIGSTYRELALLEEAREMLEPALQIARSLGEGDRPETAVALSDLAALLRASGEPGTAGPLFEEALAMNRRLYPGDHPDTANVLNNWAGLKLEQADVAGAEAMFREALAMKRRIHPGDDINVAVGLSNVAHVLQSRGELREAEQFHLEALEMMRRISAGDDPAIARTLNDLAGLSMARRDLAAAEAFLSESIDMLRRIFPGGHPDVASGLNNLAGLAMERGDLAAAEPLFREALEQWRQQHSGDHRLVARGLSNLAFVLQARQDFDAAEPLYREALAMSQRLFPGDHPSVASILNKLAHLLQQRGELGESETLFREALDMRRRLLPADHPDMQFTISNLAEVLEELEKPADAEPLWRELLKTRRAALPEGAWQVASVASRLGGSLAAQGRFAEAEPELIAGFEGLAAAPDTPRTPRDFVREAGERLAQLYQLWSITEPEGNHDRQAAEWRKRVDQLDAPVSQR